MNNVANIRVIKAKDWSQYREIRLRALLESPEAFGSTYEESIKFSDTHWLRKVREASSGFDHPMFAVVEGMIVALAWAKIERPEYSCAHLYQMWVDPNHRGNGVGKALLSSAIEWSKRKNAGKLILDVTCGDRPARHLYESFGFRAVGTVAPIRTDSALLEQTMELEL